MDIMKVQRSIRILSKPKATSNKSRNITKHNRNNKKKCMCCVSIAPTLDVPSIWDELRMEGKLCDGVIKTFDGGVFYIHRIVLSTVSRYFKACFTNCLGIGQSEIKETKIDDVPRYLVSKIIDYAYTGKCGITEENVCKIIAVADQFDCVGLLNLCCVFLLNNLKPENCLGLHKFAQDYFCKDVENKSWCYICYNFTQVYQRSNEFLELTVEDLCKILCDDRLNVKHEGITFQAIDKWINKDPEERKQHIDKLLDCVRFGNLHVEYFNNVIRNYQYNNHNTKQLLDIAEDVVNTRKETYEHRMRRPRIPYEVLFAVGGWSAGCPTNFVETYDTRADRWFLSTNTDPSPRAYHGLVLLNNLMYMVGGFDGTDHFNTMRCFDLVSHVWSEKACMYHARCYVSVCALKGEIYAIGGFNGHTRMNSAEKYDPVSNQWELIAPMNKQRSDASAASLHNKIYIVGGFNGTEVMRTVEVYDPVARQWSLVSAMGSCRSGVSLVSHHNFLYAIGGFDGNTRLFTGERYDPVRGIWERIADMFSPRSNFAAVVLDDMIFVVGGFNGTTTIALAECYDVEQNEWLEAASMNLNRSALAACVCRNLPDAREYSYLSKVLDFQQLPHSSNNSGDSSQEFVSARNQRSMRNQTRICYKTFSRKGKQRF